MSFKGVGVITRQFTTKCKHGSYTYDNETREIFCAKCNERVDPVEAIKHIARVNNQLIVKLNTHKAEMEKIEKRKRVKCEHCGRFTNLKLNLTWADKYIKRK